MLTRRTTLLAAFCAAGMALADPGHAHEAPRVETVVTLTDAGAVDVTHTLQLSSAQRLLYKAGIIEKNDMTGLRSRAQAALYSSERFQLFADDKPVPLDILGAELGGGHLYIYQTGSLTALPKKWSAKNAILRDLSPRFDNVINVPTEDGIRTIVFNGSDLDAIEFPS